MTLKITFLTEVNTVYLMYNLYSSIYYYDVSVICLTTDQILRPKALLIKSLSIVREQPRTGKSSLKCTHAHRLPNILMLMTILRSLS